MIGNAGFPIRLKNSWHFRRSTTWLGSDRHLTGHRVAFARPSELEVERGHDEEIEERRRGQPTQDHDAIPWRPGRLTSTRVP
jgi:hypothetical protein